MMSATLHQMAHKYKRLLYGTWDFSVTLVMGNIKNKKWKRTLFQDA